MQELKIDGLGKKETYESLDYAIEVDFIPNSRGNSYPNPDWKDAITNFAVVKSTTVWSRGQFSEKDTEGKLDFKNPTADFPNTQPKLTAPADTEVWEVPNFTLEGTKTVKEIVQNLRNNGDLLTDSFHVTLTTEVPLNQLSSAKVGTMFYMKTQLFAYREGQTNRASWNWNPTEILSGGSSLVAGAIILTSALYF